MNRLLLLLATLLSLAVSAHAEGVVVPAEQRHAPYSGIIPTCDDSGVLGTVSSRFAQKESTYWNSSLGISGYDRVQEIGFRADGVAYIPRRYCVARATMSDGAERTVIYQVQEKLGMIGWGYGVEWCVVGLDRNIAYAPACSVLRPIAERYLGETALRVRY